MVNESVEVFKIDQNGNCVDGALLQVLDENGTVIDEWITHQKIVSIPKGQSQWTDGDISYSLKRQKDDYRLCINGFQYYNVDENGYETSHRIRNLLANHTYTLHEVSTKENYQLSKDIPFTVSKDSIISMIDLKTDTVSISKVDASSSKELPGARLEVRDEDGKIVDEWISTDKEHLIHNLVVGKSYTLSEILAPDGYKKAESITFTIDDNGEVIQKIVMKDQRKMLFVPTGLSNDFKFYSLLCIVCILAGFLCARKVK